MRLRHPLLAGCVGGALVLAAAFALAPEPARAAAAPPVPVYGSGGANVVALQAALDDWGQDQPWTGYFAGGTTAALAAVQKTMGLAPTGVADPATLTRLGLRPGGPAMRLGSRGPDVKALQRALTRAGYPVAPTGRVGVFTEALIRAFQYSHGQRAGAPITLWTVESVLGRSGPQGVVQSAVAQLGDPYSWGGTRPSSGFDCSGLVKYTFRRDGIRLPHSTYGQWDAGRPVAAGALKPGDLVFFSTYAAGPSHVGIYLGDDLFVHAADDQEGVRIDSLSATYYFSRYLGAVDPFVG